MLVERILKKCDLIVGSSVGQLKTVVCSSLYLCIVVAKDSGIEESTSQLGSNQVQGEVVVSRIGNRRDCGIQSMNVNV